MPIIILPDDVASQIAAGEVVERPASVVKELMENALDASASQISLLVERAGKQLVEVSDDGSGISFDEIKLSVSRHATSKLLRADDLHRVKTLGFRGEALASIASVSHLTIQTRVQETPFGGRLEVNGGQIGTVEKIGSSVGTTISVRNLFYNVPARLKFLKTDSTERQKIDELVARYALAYSNVKFRLLHDGKAVLQTNGRGDRREVLASLYGVENARKMLEVELDESEFAVRGFISPITVTRANRKEITFFVNGRWIQDVALSSALLKAYQTYLMVGRYPIAFIFLELPPELVDVNVHPTKAEVRFQDSGEIFYRVQRAVRRALMAYSPVPQIPVRLWHPQLAQEQVFDPVWQTPVVVEEKPEQDALLNRSDEMRQSELPTAGTIPLLRLIGQIGGTYLVAEGPDGLYLIDQHAAHERVLYEKFLRSKGENIPSQAFLDPQVLQLPPAQAHLLEEQLGILTGIGIQVEPFGPGAFRIRAVPAFLQGIDPLAVVHVLVEDFEEDETPFQNEMEKRLIARICKRSAVKGGQVLSQAEQAKLVQDLETCQSPRTCPHGRPTMIHLSVDLLERQFGRRGSR